MSWWDDRRAELRELLATKPVSDFPNWKPICKTIHYGRYWQEELLPLMGDVKGLKSIFEFGPGYGGLCEAIKEAGFGGDYYLYDFPEMEKIQRHYLEDQSRIYWEIPTEPVDLFISTWALSEAPIELRESILSRVKADTYVFIYQPEWEGIDNKAFFEGVFGMKVAEIGSAGDSVAIRIAS